MSDEIGIGFMRFRNSMMPREVVGDVLRGTMRDVGKARSSLKVLGRSLCMGELTIGEGFKMVVEENGICKLE